MSHPDANETTGYVLCHRTLSDNVGTAQQDAGLQSCSESQTPGIGSASWQAWWVGSCAT